MAVRGIILESSLEVRYGDRLFFRCDVPVYGDCVFAQHQAFKDNHDLSVNQFERHGEVHGYGSIRLLRGKL